MLKKRCLPICLTVLSILMLTLSTAQTSINVIAASPPPKTLTGYIPSAVTSGQVRFIGQHPGTDQLALAIGLPLRNAQALTQLLNEASTPRNPHYRHYLTLTQENQLFNPTPQQEQQVVAWLQANGLTVTHTYPNHLLVDTIGTFAQVERLLHITLIDYTISLDGKTTAFYAPAMEPTLPGSVSNLVNSIVGLDNFPRVHTDNATGHPTFTNEKANGQPPFYPQDFANAYDVNPLWNLKDNGSNQHIGITLWGTPPSDATLYKFAHQTGANVATQANGQLQVFQVPCLSGCHYNTLGGIEAGIDVESSSGMAPGAIIDYYQVPTDKNGSPTDTGLEDALNQAGSDGYNNQQISNSWVRECETQDAFTTSVESILQSNTATGHDYLFASGDTGSACTSPLNSCHKLQDPYPTYPASSAYVTSVGGTNLSIQNNSWQSEIAWDYTTSSCYHGFGKPPMGSGGGYSKLFAQPSWQVGFSKNKHRGYPDVSADADLFTGAYICIDNGSKKPTCGTVGGTSLATPLWAGMIADVNEYLTYQGELPLGFINPLLYEMNTGMLYTAYHDIQIGMNGKYQAGPGWDAVTGLGSPDLYNLARDAATLVSNGYLSSVAMVSATDAWAVSDYTYSNNGTLIPLIEHWNGTIWNVVPGPGSDYGIQLSSVAAVSANDVWAVGYYVDPNGAFLTLIEHWDGSVWNMVPSPSPSNSNALSSVTAVSANDVWAVGHYVDPNNYEYTLIEHWDGSSWKVVPSPNPSPDATYLYGVAAASASNVWAVGTYDDSNNGTYDTLIEHWDGSSWKVVPSPNPSPDYYYLYGVAAVSANDVWAVGYSDTAPQTLIEHWDGSSWKVVPSPNPPGQDLYPTLLSVAAASANDVWAVGSYITDPSNGSRATLFEHWNGSTWNIVPSPSPGYSNELLSVAAVSANDVWAVGNYVDSYNEHTLIEQWNGSTWTVIPSPNPPN